MTRLLQVIVSLPTVVFTVLVGVSLVYWLSVMLGAIDLEVSGTAEGGHEGHEGHGDGDHGGVLSALGGVELRKVPVMVRVSFVAIFGWLVSTLGGLMLGPVFAGGQVPAAVFHAALGAVALVAGVRLAGLAARPLAPLFTSARAQRKEQLVGQLAEVTTGRLDDRFGQVLVKDGGAGLLLDARHEGATLARGSRVVITHYDEARNLVTVEPFDPATGVRAEVAGGREGLDAGAGATGPRDRAARGR
jgi:hypothetical protein